MLESISWQHFFTAIALIIGGYYVITTLLLYSGEIESFFRQKKSIHSSPEVQPDQTSSNESVSVMGSVRYERRGEQNVPRENIADVAELQVAPLREEEEDFHAVDPVQEVLRDDLTSLQSEIISLVEVVSQVRKAEGIDLFKTLLSNYPQFVGTTYQGELSQFIHDACKQSGPHYFSLKEIHLWWTEPNIASNNHP